MRICVFCGSRAGVNPQFARTAVEMGQLLAARGIGIVFGGGRVGLMGILADAARAAGGEVIGVIPRALADREVAHQNLSELHIVESMHERKAMMAELSAGFIALPGGFGTFEEFCEALTWTQLGIHDKPCGLLNLDGYYDPLIAMFDRGVADGFISVENRTLSVEAPTCEGILDRVIAAMNPRPRL